MVVSSRAVRDTNGNKIPLLDSDGKQMRYAVKKKRANGNVSIGKIDYKMNQEDIPAWVYEP